VHISEVDSIFIVARVCFLKDHHGRLPLASGRKWRIRAVHIRPKAKRGATNATSIAIVKLARTTSDLRLAMRRVRSGTCVASARTSISRSKKLQAISMHTNSPAKTLQGRTRGVDHSW